MRKFRIVGVGLLILSLAAFLGCTGQQGSTPRDSDKASKKGGDDDHDHGELPHKGTLIEFGNWHGEFTVNHHTREATVYILNPKGNTAAPIKIDKPLLSIKNPQFQVELKPVPQEGDPAGKSSRYVGKSEKFQKEQEYEGTFSGVVDGKPYAGDFKEEPEGHEHDKK